ncbi:I78 family peptidase inhibitor [Tsuneonella sp. HG222]
MRLFPLVALVPALTLGACATTGDYGERGACRVEPASRFIGQTATAELGWKIQAAAGAQTLRWVPPRSAVTMDFNANRLNVEYDDAMVVTAVKCG